VFTHVRQGRQLALDLELVLERRRLRAVENRGGGSGSSGFLRVHTRLGKATRVAREQACPSHVAELEEEEHDTLKTDTSTSVLNTVISRRMPKKEAITNRWASILEAVEILLHGRRVDAGLPHTLFKQWRVVDALSTGENLLTTQEEVEGVGEFL
jgi:hypothetical protein